MPLAGLIRESTSCCPSSSGMEQRPPAPAGTPLLLSESESAEGNRFVSGCPGGRKDHHVLSRLFVTLRWRDREPTCCLAGSLKGMKHLKRNKKIVEKMSTTNTEFPPWLFLLPYTFDQWKIQNPEKGKVPRQHFKEFI